MPRPLSSLALGGIALYQRHLSPRKGYACAHRVHHGGTGCSGYAKGRIAEVGLWRAIPDIRQRFAACKTAAATLRAERCTCATHTALPSQITAGDDTRAPQKPTPKKRRRADSCRPKKEDCACESCQSCFESALLLRFCRGGGKSSADGDCGPCDCGDIGGCAP